MQKGEPPPPSWKEPSPSVPSSLTRWITMPSGSGAFEATDRGLPLAPGTQRIGEPSGYVPEIAMGTSNVVPTSRNFSSGERTAIVGTRCGFSDVLHVYRSMRGESLPLPETD